MSRVLLLSSEPIRPRMAGIGIRYLELAQRLSAAGLGVILASPAAPDQGAGLPAAPDQSAGSPAAPDRSAGLPATPEDGTAMLPPEIESRRVEVGQPGGLLELANRCDAAVAQGQIANDLLLAAPALPVAIDLYDPWMVENLAYFETLGLDPYRNDHATWTLQMSRGDFFLCSSEEQRTFYLGYLAALGRVNPERVAADPDLRSLIDVVPFGVADELPPHRPYLPEVLAGGPAAARRLLFGGLYDWYDPWTLLAALAALDRPDWQLLLIRNPNAGTPQRLFAAVEAHCRKLGWWGSRVVALDWVPAERRYDLLRDVDVLVAPHRPSLETRLALRTRFLDALAAGCPVVTSEGGAMSEMLRRHGAGQVVPPGDPRALAKALAAVLDGDGQDSVKAGAGAAGGAAAARDATRRAAAVELLAAFRWERAMAPLLAFCRTPRRDATKDRYVTSLATTAPADGWGFRLRRRLRLLWAAATAGGGA